MCTTTFLMEQQQQQNIVIFTMKRQVIINHISGKTPLKKCIFRHDVEKKRTKRSTVTRKLMMQNPQIPLICFSVSYTKV